MGWFTYDHCSVIIHDCGCRCEKCEQAVWKLKVKVPRHFERGVAVRRSSGSSDDVKVNRFVRALHHVEA